MSRILGLDLGETTIGVAISNSEQTLSLPLKTIRYSKGNYKKGREEVIKLCKEEKITKIVLGYPISMDGTIGPRAESVMRFKSDLEEESPNLLVFLQDERLSTFEAKERLLASGLKQDKIKAPIDEGAASVIFESYLKRKENTRNENRW